jgi:type I restriction enzyme M protein
MTTATIVQRVWNYCNTLRDDGVSYGDYVEQLTYLLFLKMADEYCNLPKSRITLFRDWLSILKQAFAGRLV